MWVRNVWLVTLRNTAEMRLLVAIIKDTLQLKGQR